MGFFPLEWLIRRLAKRFANQFWKSWTVVNPPWEVVFTYVPAGWIEKPCWGDLTRVWRNGIPATGVTGFLCGKASQAGPSTLWVPESPNYLAWCGVYIYKPDRFQDFYHPEQGATKLAREIGYQDDLSWAKIYGNPKASYEEIYVERLDQPLLDVSFQTESYFSVVRCQTYLGPRSLRWQAVLASEVIAELYKNTSGIYLSGAFFRPTSELCRTHTYEDVLRDVWVTRVLFPDKGLIYVLYATSVRAVDGSWNYSKVLYPEFKRFFRGIRFVRRSAEKGFN